MSEEKLKKLLYKTADFHKAVQTHVGNLNPFEDYRSLVSF